jgi:hypothetical protein
MQAVRVDQVRLTRLQARLHHLNDFKRRRKMPPGVVASTANMSSHTAPGECCLDTLYLAVSDFHYYYYYYYYYSTVG